MDEDLLYPTLGTGAGFGDYRAQAAYHLLCGDVNQGADWVEKLIMRAIAGQR